MPSKSYANDSITVHWRPERCIHVGTCLRALPEVFDLQSRPWIDVDAAAADEIAVAVEQCPSGALTYERSGAGEEPDAETTLAVARNGPLIARGELVIELPSGEVLAEEPRAALCRCGMSSNQPFCDNTHRKEGWESDGEMEFEGGPCDATGQTRIVPTEDGPLRVTGGAKVRRRSGEQLGEDDTLVLCRCGQSAHKPLCDQSHVDCGFSSKPGEVSEGRSAADSPAEFDSNRDL